MQQFQYKTRGAVERTDSGFRFSVDGFLLPGLGLPGLGLPGLALRVWG